MMIIVIIILIIMIIIIIIIILTTKEATINGDNSTTINDWSYIRIAAVVAKNVSKVLKSSEAQKL